MRWIIYCLICLAVALPAAQAESKGPKILGILGGKANENLRGADPVLERFRRTPIALYDKPDKELEPVKEAAPKAFFSDHYHLNREGPLVYGRHPYDWYLIGYEGRGYWINPLPNITLYRYLELLMARKTHLKDWEWQIYTEPAGSETLEVAKSDLAEYLRDKPPVEVTETRELRGEVWIRFKLLDSRCYEKDRPPKVILTGWLPAYQPDNDTTFWFQINPC